MAHADDKIVSIRAKFGMWGVGTYWTLLERIGEQMKDDKSTPSATLLLPEICSFLGCKPNKLETFLDHLQNIRGMFWKRNGNVLEIKVEKMRELAAEYIKRGKPVQTQSGLSPTQEVEVDVEVDKKKKEIARAPEWKEVQELWKSKSYPSAEAAKFFAHYSSNGWRVGKNPMKNWKAAAAGWVMRSKEYSPQNQTPHDTRPVALKSYKCRWGCGAKLTENEYNLHDARCPEYAKKAVPPQKEFTDALDGLTKKMRVV